jgi:hypothetical protein
VPKPTLAELPDGIATIGYELDMFVCSAAMASQLPPIGFETNAFIESALIHARGLAFFFAGSKDSDDIHWSNFTPKWTRSPSGSITFLGVVRRPLNKYLAHPTWTRIRDGKRTWDLAELVDHVLEVARSWADALDSEQPALGRVFRTGHLEKAERLLSPAPSRLVARTN